MRRRTLLQTGLAVTAAPAVAQAAVQTLRIGMTTSDLPTTGGIPDNGSEGGRFAGYTIYDALVNWDFTRTDAFADLTPGLATEWHIDPDNHLRWIFTLREGVRYHDGTLLKADDIIWNFDRHLNEHAPHFDRAQALTYRPYTSQVKRYERIDDTHVALYTEAPFSMLPHLLSRVFMVSPTQFAKVGNWLDFQKSPAGTGPFKVVRVSPHVSIESGLLVGRHCDSGERPMAGQQQVFRQPGGALHLRSGKSPPPAGRGRLRSAKPVTPQGADSDCRFRQHGAAADGRVRAAELQRDRC